MISGESQMFFRLTVLFLGLVSALMTTSASAITLLELAQSADNTPEDLQRRWSNEDNQQVVLRGFLYQTNQGGWILSSQPNLKTCCVGNPINAKSQVAVQGNEMTASPDRVVTLQGTFRVVPTYDNDKVLVSLFQLRDAEHIPETPQSHLPLTLLLGCVIAVGAFFVLFRMRK